MAGSRETQDRQPIYGAVIPLARPAKLDRERLREELRAVAKLAGAGARMADDAPSKRGLLSSLTGKPDAVKVETKAEKEPVFHTVKKGDNLWKIAEAAYGKGKGTRYKEIFEANRPMLSDPDKIYPGQVLRIP